MKKHFLPVKVLAIQKGFSLVEILIAVSLLSVGAIALMSMSASTSLSLKKAANKNSEIALQTEINQILADSNFCKKAVVGKASPLTDMTAPYKMRMQLPSVPAVFQEGITVDNKVKITDFHVENFSAPVAGPTSSQRKVNGVLWMTTKDVGTEAAILRPPLKVGVVTFVYENATKNIVDCYGQSIGPKESCLVLGFEWVGNTCREPVASSCAKLGGTWNGTVCVFDEISSRQSTLGKMCSAGSYLRGYDNNGQPVCSVLPSSPPAPPPVVTNPTPIVITNPTPVVVTAPPSPTPACTRGAFISSDGRGTEWACNCPGDGRTGWSNFANGCSHRIADWFCSSSSTQTYWVCSVGVPTGAGWTSVGGGCYHLGTSRPCN